MKESKPIIVGEHNPYGSGPGFAMYPFPRRSAGGRLCHLVMGLGVQDYLEAFKRVNLLDDAPKWSAPLARAEAERLLDQHVGRRVLVLCGARVAKAFGAADSAVPRRELHPRRSGEALLVVLPHPSGRSRAWNDPSMVERCRAVLRGACPSIPFGGVRGDDG